MDILLKSILSGDRRALSKAITMMESSHPDDQEKANQLAALLPPPLTQTYRIGLSGPPGAGKSTLIESLGLYLIQQGHRVAVLAVDPTSPASGGSLLGDKTRMEYLSRSADAFIRPSSSTKNFLGGITPHTPEVIKLLEAAHFDVILLETIGIGQNEVDAFDVVDMLLLVLSPAAGDELQGLKKGILELVHMIAVNKWDGDLREMSDITHQHYHSAVTNMGSQNGWTPPVIKCSALEKVGIDELWRHVMSYYKTQGDNIHAVRLEQAKIHFDKLVQHHLVQMIKKQPTFSHLWDQYRHSLEQTHIPPRVVCHQFIHEIEEKLNSFLKNNV